MFGLQPLHLIIIIVVGMLIFGPKRLPEIGRYLGKTITEFRSGTQEFAKSLEEEASRPIRHDVISPVEQAVATADAGNFCAQCGKPNPAQAGFCGHCGTALTKPESTATNTETTA